MNTETTQPEEGKGERAAAMMPVYRGPFGPVFFLRHLRAFIRERCPSPSEGLPVVELHLVSGEVLDVCHVIGLAPDFLALAVRDTTRDPESLAMRTELLPYEGIHRVTVRSARAAGAHVGFVQERMPHVIGASGAADAHSAEEALLAAATPQPHSGGAGPDGGPPGREKGAGDAHRH